MADWVTTALAVTVADFGGVAAGGGEGVSWARAAGGTGLGGAGAGIAGFDAAAVAGFSAAAFFDGFAGAAAGLISVWGRTLAGGTGETGFWTGEAVFVFTVGADVTAAAGGGGDAALAGDFFGAALEVVVRGAAGGGSCAGGDALSVGLEGVALTAFAGAFLVTP